MGTIESIVKEIEVICYNHAEELGIDDPVEEEYFDEYVLIKGATDEELIQFENQFHVTLPDDFKELYCYKNGSRFMLLLFPMPKYTYRF